MFQIIILGSLLIVAISVFASYQSATKPHNHILMGILLPEERLKNPEVLRLAGQLKKTNTLIFILFLIAGLPIRIIPYTSFVMLYMGIWCAAYFIIIDRCFNRYFTKLLLLKSKNRWFPNDYEYRILTVDQEEIENRNKLILVFRKLVPTTKERLLAEAEQPIYVDEDEYWINGYYYNPNDNRTTVEKRVGCGTTNNLATRLGKIMACLAPVITVAVIGAVFIVFLMMDFATFRMSIEENTVKINAPFYDYQFQAEDIVEVTLTQDLPEGGIRTNGAATGTYYLGNFNFDSYGSSKVFVYTKYPPYIVILLTDKTVLFNTKSEEETEKDYEKLVGLK